MCNVDEDEEKAPVARVNRFSATGNKCVKCDQQGIVITRRHDSFCTDCFRIYVVHKFRSAIGKSKLIRDGERVLVAFSGGANSAALLHLISDGLSLRAHKKLRFIPTLLHIDEYTVLEDFNRKRHEILCEISQLMLQTGFQAYITSLEQGINVDENPSNLSYSMDPLYWEASFDPNMLHEPPESERKRLKEIFLSLPSLTCKEDFLRNFRNQLIINVARKLGFNKVFSAECSSRLSVRILADIAQGRGSQVYLDAGFSDSRNDDVMVIRPIRDLTAKEVVMYNSLFNVSSVFLPTFTTKAVTGASIEHLTESFVTGLQADFPSTTGNIVRTSEKLSQSSNESCVKCLFCRSPLDTNVPKSSALNAVLFSKKLSRFGKEYKTGDDDQDVSAEHPGTMDDSQSNIKDTTLGDLLPYLCFGCRLSLQDFRGDVSTLSFLSKQSEDQDVMKQTDNLRDQIAEYLIDDL